MKLLDRTISEIKNSKLNERLSEMVGEIVSKFNEVLVTNNVTVKNTSFNSKNDASNRLKLVLMHDRSKIAPGTLEKMRDELVDVISRYVEIDREALDLNLEDGSNTIALVANIPLLRSK